MKPKRVVVVGADYPDLEKFCPNWRGMKAGLARMKLEWKFVSCRPELNVQEIIDFGPDLIVYALLDVIKRPDWRQQVRHGCPGAKIVFWYGDLRNEQTGQIMADCSDTIDTMFVSNNAQRDFYRRYFNIPEVHYLPLGCEPIEKPIVNKMLAFDFVFIGGQMPVGAFHDRAKNIQKFRDEGGLTLVNSFEPAIRARIFKEMPSIYSSSRVCLDVSHFTDIDGYTSIRYWEIPAFYGFALTKRWPGCEEFYPPETRAYFDTFEEAIDMKNHFINNEGVRTAMLRQAHELSYNHTYDKRFAQMFAKI